MRIVREEMCSGLQRGYRVSSGRVEKDWASQCSLDLLVDGFQLLLKHDGERLHIGLSTGGEQLSPKHPLSLLLI